MYCPRWFEREIVMPRESQYFMEGYLFSFFSLLAFWLLGFLASWLLAFSASWLLGFLASWLFGFGFWWFLALAFRILCIPSSSSAGGDLAFAFMRLLAAMAFRILCFHTSSLGIFSFAHFHWFLDFASRSISITSSSLFESTLLQTSLNCNPI